MQGIFKDDFGGTCIEYGWLKHIQVVQYLNNFDLFSFLNHRLFDLPNFHADPPFPSQNSHLRQQFFPFFFPILQHLLFIDKLNP